MLLERLTWPRVVESENGEDHWANYLTAGTDQYDMLRIEAILNHALFE